MAESDREVLNTPAADSLAERYRHILQTGPSHIAAGLVGDSSPVGFQRRGQAKDRLDAACEPLRRQYTIVGFGSGAARRFYVVPTFEKWRAINGWACTPAASGKKASS